MVAVCYVSWLTCFDDLALATAPCLPRVTEHMVVVIVQVDRSVTGLVAQQQCVGPLHTPLSNVAVLALSHFDTKGKQYTAYTVRCRPCSGHTMRTIPCIVYCLFATCGPHDMCCTLQGWLWL